MRSQTEKYSKVKSSVVIPRKKQIDGRMDGMNEKHNDESAFKPKI